MESYDVTEFRAMAFCTKCGRPNEQGARFCNNCGAAMWGVTARSQSVRSASAPTVLPRPRVVVVQGGIKSSGLAAVLSFFWCGLGQIYTGQIGTGIALMLGYPVMLFFGAVLTFGGALSQTGGTVMLGLIFLAIALALWIFGMVNAYHTAERMNQQDLARL
jgi:TM2 domain-containing membrane protein YozV